MSVFTIDIRMFNASGIGTYLRNLIPKIISALPYVHFNLLGQTLQIRQYHWAQGQNISLIDCSAPIYSVSEQFELFSKIPKETTIFWSPHYNIPLFYRGKLVVTVFDVFHLVMPKLTRNLHKSLYARLMFGAVKQKADAILSISRFTENELVRLVGINREKIHTVHLGVDSTWFEIQKGHSPHSKPFVLYVGNVKPHKNLTKLLQAFRLIINKIPHDLIIVGKKDGFITGDHQVIAMAEKFEDRVYFTGHVDDAMLRQYFVNADTLVFPSLYEGFGLPPLEAMACGCPVVVSSAASLPEVCGNAAYYMDPYNVENIADRIYEVLTVETLRKAIIQKGLERARLFRWEKTAEETLHVLKEAME